MTRPTAHSETTGDGEFRIGDGARMTYRRPAEHVMDVHHTFVDPAHRGEGLAQALYYAMVAFAREQRRKVIPTCSFVASMFERNPEDADVLR